MRKIRFGLVLLAVAAASAAPSQMTVQISSGAAYTGYAGPQTRTHVALAWDQDVTPNAPGNADKSIEIFLLDLTTNALTQVTSLAAGGIAFPIAWMPDGRLLVRANGDVTTPGAAPGGGIRLYLHKPARGGRAGTTTLVSPALNFGSDEPAVLVAPNGKTWFFRTTAPLGDNPDGSNEVFAFDPKKRKLRQLTNATNFGSHVLGLVEKGKRLLIWSSADLTGRGTNAAGVPALFLLDLKTSAVVQITSGEYVFPAVAQIDPTGRWIAHTELVLVGQGARFDAKIYDLKTKTSRLVLREGTLWLVPGSSLALLNSKEDLVPSSTPGQGNADGSTELFSMDLKTGEIVQLTATDRDTRLVQPGANRNAPAIVESAGDLTPGAPGNAGGVSHLYLVSFAAKPKPTVQLTSGPEPVAFEIVAGQFALFRSYGDLVAGGNADGSLEVFAVNLRGAPTIRQISNGIDGATFIWGNPPPDGKSVFLASTADLAPGAPGNADGSLELFRAKLR